MLQLLLTLPSQAVQGKQLLHQLEKSPHPPAQPPHVSLDTFPSLLPTKTDRREASRRSYLFLNREHRRQQQALSPCLLPTVLPGSNT